MNQKKPPTVSVRIRESDYDILMTLMHQENQETITDTITWAIHVASQVSSTK